jgi:protein SCO1
MLPCRRSSRLWSACVALLLLLAPFWPMLSGTGWAQEQKFVWDPQGLDDFSLTECHGQTVTKADLLGKPWVACFIFTRCAGANFCPRVSAEMRELQRGLKDVDVRLVTFTVDPERDTPEELLKYSAQFDADPDKWWFLTGERDVIYGLIRHGFKMIVHPAANPIPGFEIEHSLEIMHVDEKGIVRGRYNATDDVSMARLRRVLKKGEASPEDLALIRQGEQEELRQAEALKIARAEAEARLLAEEQAELRARIPAWVQRIPAVNAALNGLATVLLVAGLVFIKSGKRDAHRKAMLAAFGTSAVFLACYVAGHVGLYYYTGSGSRPFAGTGVIRGVYLAILGTHVLLAIVVAVMAPWTLFRGLQGEWDRHKKLARVTFPIWLYVSVTGVIIYFILYHWPV